MTTQAFERQNEFWRRESPKLVGDYISRPAIVGLAQGFGDFRELNILESGCGQGLLAKMIIQSGAKKVFAIDKSKKMLEQARELTSDRDIQYDLMDMTRTNYPNESFDVVFSHSVLLYSTQGEVNSFFTESTRLLNRFGRLVVGLPHPYLFEQESPARSSEQNWIKFSKITQYDGYSIPNEFEMTYFDQKGENFTDLVYAHTLNGLFNSAQKAGLSLKHLREVEIPKDVVQKSQFFGTRYGYPAYMHMAFTK